MIVTFIVLSILRICGAIKSWKTVFLTTIIVGAFLFAIGFSFETGYMFRQHEESNPSNNGYVPS